MDLNQLLKAAGGILGNEDQQPVGNATVGGSLGGTTLPPAEQAALLANPAVAYQIAQNPFLASSLLHHAQAAAASGCGRSPVDPDVQELADHFGLDERITRQLDEELKKRPVTWEGDLLALWDILKDARSPPGLLQAKIREMQANTFVGQPTMDKDIEDLQRKYQLDDQATRKLAEVLQKRSATREQDVELMHRHLETSNKPSARVMMMLGKLRSGEPLPEPDKRIAPGSYLDRIEREKERKKEEAKDRSRRSRSRRRRSRSRERRRSRSRRRSGSRDRRSGGASNNAGGERDRRSR